MPAMVGYLNHWATAAPSRNCKERSYRGINETWSPATGVLTCVATVPLTGRAPIFKSRRLSQAVKVSDHGWSAMDSWPVPLKTRRLGARCTLNLSRAQTSSHWCCVVAIRVGASPGVVLVTCPRFKITRSVAKSRRVAEQCDVKLHSHAHPYL
ncbi:uncharacterized protein TNCV_859391 [Trichonephila clavipes]|nr:uncharacterized protein TNCV_859391 [Trichonephila clavipes]